MPSAALTWIEPGASATFIWHGAAAPRPGGGRLYVVSGPILEQPPASPYFILAAEEEGDFATRLYRGQVALPYLDDINAFMPAAAPLYVTAEAHAAAQREPEQFGTAWVCDECGEAEDAGVFLWTAHRGPRVRVCFLIHNDAGVWTCRLHPFEFAKETP